MLDETGLGVPIASFTQKSDISYILPSSNTVVNAFQVFVIIKHEYDNLVTKQILCVINMLDINNNHHEGNLNIKISVRASPA